MLEKLFIYYTNDLHSKFDHWSRVTSFFKQEKADRIAANETSWLFDVGDHVDRVHPIAEAFMGKANVSLLNEAGYDAVTIGNNEGITVSHEDLEQLYDDASFQVVCGNLHSQKATAPQWLKPHVTFTSNQGVKVGIIGLTAPFNDYYELLDWHVSAPYEALKTYVQSLKQETDVIILLSHLGLSEDEEIARRFPEIDLIIGGHTHHLLRNGEYVNNILITAAGKHCAFVGEVILTWDHAKRCLVNKEAYAIDILNQPKDLATEQKLAVLEEEANTILEKTIVHIDHPLEVRWFSHTQIMQDLTDMLKAWTNADCAMLNAGVLLDQLPAGAVTYKDVHRICPHPINPCVVTLSGSELLEVTRASLTKDFMELKLKGFGFRGEVIGRMIFSGIDVVTERHANGHEYVKTVLFNGAEIDGDRIYRVATADTFTFGRLLPEIAKSETKEYMLPEFLRDILSYTLQKKYTNA
ncbi:MULTISPECIES: bifunctional UDP-sugar hydrolase/5'-nucleotidase [unclassified Virgibacillus]|uniref:bifunctional metallophosphatase/5'-nucleotidase n=1 Tax=unclassified Virgibacillus TaxID=2620237 RepID=UPI0024DF00C4|nr:bifunctional UDP-sugar hydrolase/5'-nucleotidase [Virgibacillus sp. LDC-1]